MDSTLSKQYWRVALRVEEACVPPLYRKMKPYFLTSLNISDQPECYSPEDIFEQFWRLFENASDDLPRLDSSVPPSDILYFDWEAVRFVRKSW